MCVVYCVETPHPLIPKNKNPKKPEVGFLLLYTSVRPFIFIISTGATPAIQTPPKFNMWSTSSLGKNVFFIFLIFYFFEFFWSKKHKNWLFLTDPNLVNALNARVFELGGSNFIYSLLYTVSTKGFCEFGLRGPGASEAPWTQIL